MGKPVKFASQIDEKVLSDLKAYVSEADRSISSVVSEAVAQYLDRVRVRPAFRKATEDAIGANVALLKRLAK